MKVYIPSNQIEKYKAIEEEAEEAEFIAMVEKLPRGKQLKLLWFARWIILRRKIKRLLGIEKSS